MTQQKPEPRREGVLPWTSAFGLALGVFGLIGTINGSPSGVMLLLVGVVLLVVGLVMRASRKRNALLERQTAALERQVALEEERRREQQPPA
ncbi:hypothetical protein ACFWE5_03640 [Cellulosimicrobium funkei]|uniref:hypothetical protein n=1 Tax=Cellulosimicrobium funkei TaxID=264251 RepID=UPI00364C9807